MSFLAFDASQVTLKSVEKVPILLVQCSEGRVPNSGSSLEKIMMKNTTKKIIFAFF